MAASAASREIGLAAYIIVISKQVPSLDLGHVLAALKAFGSA